MRFSFKTIWYVFSLSKIFSEFVLADMVISFQTINGGLNH
jgi:hypothetical protein